MTMINKYGTKEINGLTQSENYAHVIPNPHDFHSFSEHKSRYF